MFLFGLLIKENDILGNSVWISLDEVRETERRKGKLKDCSRLVVILWRDEKKHPIRQCGQTP